MTPYFNLVSPTYIENWPDALHRLSIASARVPLLEGEAEALGASNGEYAEAFPAPHFRDLSALQQRLDDAIQRFPGGAFVRLGSRSPKDSWDGAANGFRCLDGARAIKLMTDSSERVSDDLHLAIANGYTPSIWVRQWLEIQPWQEWRCLMRGRKLIGVSQYNYRIKDADGIKAVADTANLAAWAIGEFSYEFQAASHLGDAVFDVILYRKTRQGESGPKRTETEVKLLEVNPFCEMTDPCLFRWDQLPDRKLRYMDHQGGVQTIDL